LCNRKNNFLGVPLSLCDLVAVKLTLFERQIVYCHQDSKAQSFWAAFVMPSSKNQPHP